jgi:hypothetical protein
MIKIKFTLHSIQLNLMIFLNINQVFTILRIKLYGIMKKNYANNQIFHNLHRVKIKNHGVEYFLQKN